MRALSFLVFAPAALAAQTVTGRVVDSASHRPLAHVTVRLVPGADSARDTVFAAGETAGDGVFALQAPAPGSYRVRLGEQLVGPVVALATPDAVDAHEYAITLGAGADAAPAVLAYGRVYEEKETDQRARVSSGGPRPDLSAILTGRESPTGSATYRAVIECVVNMAGHCEPGSIRVVSTNNGTYAAAMSDYLAHVTFTPGSVGGHAVRQRTQQTYTAGVSIELRRVPGGAEHGPSPT